MSFFLKTSGENMNIYILREQNNGRDLGVYFSLADAKKHGEAALKTGGDGRGWTHEDLFVVEYEVLDFVDLDDVETHSQDGKVHYFPKRRPKNS